MCWTKCPAKRIIKLLCVTIIHLCTHQTIFFEVLAVAVEAINFFHRCSRLSATYLIARPPLFLLSIDFRIHVWCLVCCYNPWIISTTRRQVKQDVAPSTHITNSLFYGSGECARAMQCISTPPRTVHLLQVQRHRRSRSCRWSKQQKNKNNYEPDQSTSNKDDL